MADIKEIKQILITLDYPGVKWIKTDDDVRRIISLENRKVFLKWVFEKLEPGGFTSLDEDTISARLLELVESNGLCPYQEITNFVNGNMDYENQLIIIERTLNFLCTSPKEKKNSDLLERNKSRFKDFDSLIKHIDETFPCLLNPESTSYDVTEMGETLKTEKEDLLKKLEELEKNDLVELDLKEIKEPNMEELNKNLNKFQIKSELIKNKPVITHLETKIVKIPPGLKEASNSFIQMQENVDLIANFNENLSPINVVENPLNKKVAELVTLSKELRNL